MAVNVNATRRQRALDSLAADASRTFSQTIDGAAYVATLSNPQIRNLSGVQVFSVDVLITKDGVLFFDDRVNMPNPPQLIIRPNGSTQDNPLQALRNTLLDVLRSCTNNFTTPHLMRGANGQLLGDTLAVRSTTADGRILSNGSTNWATIRGGGTLTSNTANSLIYAQASDIGPGTEYSIYQSFLDFDTSSLGSSATISNAVFTFYGTGTVESNANSYNMQVRAYNWGGTLTTADYIDTDPTSGWTNLTLMSHLAVGSWVQTNNTANNLTVDSYANVSKTGVTYVVVGLSGIGSTTAPTGLNEIEFYSANNSGTSSDPLLTVTYTPAPSGSGAISLGPMTAYGVGVMQPSGTGAISFGAVTAAGAGEESFPGTGAVSLGAMTAAGTGEHLDTAGTGAISFAAMTADGVGVAGGVGTGAISFGAVVADGVGVETISGSGAISLGTVVVDGVGVMQPSGTGAISFGPVVADGVGVMQPSGTGAIAFGAMTATGAGVESFPGTGAVALAAVIAAGSGTLTESGSGGVTLAVMTASGVGVETGIPTFATYTITVDMNA